MTKHFSEQLADLTARGQLRQLPNTTPVGKWLMQGDKRYLNLSGNDYLGLAADDSLRDQFWHSDAAKALPLSSSSSRLLTGDFPIKRDLEALLAKQFKREAALLLNSGYHANMGILPALADKNTLILADKWVHASLIDGIRLSGAKYLRYPHNDYTKLAQLVEEKHTQYQCIIIVTESLFSMDGDCADLPQLVALKKCYGNVMLYVDEAHAIGAYGDNGLGLAEAQGYLADIDILVGTFGKALASVGAYVVCDQIIKTYLINTMRPLIFSTALPPINVAWSHFIFSQLPHWQAKREQLAALGQHLRGAIHATNPQATAGDSYIVPLLLGDNHRAVAVAQHLQAAGLYCLPIRPPTVPAGTARVRFSLNAAIHHDELEALCAAIPLILSTED